MNYSKILLLAIPLTIIMLFGSCSQKMQMQGCGDRATQQLNYYINDTGNPIFEAVKTNDEETIKKFLENNTRDIVKDKLFGMSLLHLAAVYGNIKIAKLLLSKGFHINERDNFGYTPLHMAAGYGHTNMVKLLISRGADINAQADVNALRLTVLNYCYNTDNTLLDLILGKNEHNEDKGPLIPKKVDFNFEHNPRSSPLHLAIKYGHNEIVELLITKRSINDTDKFHKSPLYYAVESNNIKVVELLLSEGADANCSCNSGKPLLHHAVEKGNINIVGLLLAAGADINSKDIDDMTPLHHAVNNKGNINNINIVGLLLAAGADINSRDIGGMTPLHYAAEQNNFIFFKVINYMYPFNKVEMISILKLSLEKNCNLYNKIYDKNVIIETLKLSALKVDFSIKNLNNQTALDIAKDKGYVGIVQILEELEKVVS